MNVESTRWNGLMTSNEWNEDMHLGMSPLLISGVTNTTLFGDMVTLFFTFCKSADEGEEVWEGGREGGRGREKLM